MPVYEYKCPTCQEKHTQVHGMNEGPSKTKCDNCQSDLVRVFTFGAIAFNGDGFYSNDKKTKIEIDI